MIFGPSTSGNDVWCYVEDGPEVAVTRTDKICPHDFAVSLTYPGRPEFAPTHVHLLLSLHLQRTSNPAAVDALLGSFEQLYAGGDPVEIAAAHSNLKFSQELDTLAVSLRYAQLLMIEQEFNYGTDGCKSSRVSPPREFLMRFIRWTISGNDQIDKIIANAVRNFPPPPKYASKGAPPVHP